MKKVVSYRQKLIELARIYKIDKVFDQNLKHTTYDIEIILLKNNVPIPSRRGYISHKLLHEFVKPVYEQISRKISIDISFNKYFKHYYLPIKKKYT